MYSLRVLGLEVLNLVVRITTVPQEALGENSFQAFLLTSGGSQHSLVYSHITSVSASISTWPSPCLYAFPFLSLVKNTHHWLHLGPTLIHDDLKILTLITFAKTLIPNKVTWGSRGQMFVGRSLFSPTDGHTAMAHVYQVCKAGVDWVTDSLSLLRTLPVLGLPR